MSKFVYFIKPVGLSGPIKIGSSCEPEGRLSQLADWSPWPLEILARIPGTLALERQLHGCFAHAHQHREWFAPDPDLVAGISALRDGAPIEVAFDLSKQSGSIRSKPANYGTRKSPQYREWWSYVCKLRSAERRHAAKAHREAWEVLRASRRETPLTDAEKVCVEQAIAAAKLRPDIFES